MGRTIARPLFVALSMLLGTARAARPQYWRPEATPVKEAEIQFQTNVHVPEPTKAPILPVELIKRDGPTCGYFSNNGAANVCETTQYCTTIATGQYGVYNCCNPDNCYLGSECPDCNGAQCITSYISVGGTWLSRFGCGSSPSTVFLYWYYSDTPAYTQSLAEASASSKAAAEASKSAAEESSRSASLAAEASKNAEASKSAAEASKSAAEASSRSASLAAEASKSAASLAAQTTQTIRAGTTATAESAATSSSTSLVQKAGNGLKARAIAGIAVGVVVGVAAIATGLYILHRIRKKSREDEDDMPQITGTTYSGKAYPTSGMDHR